MLDREYDPIARRDANRRRSWIALAAVAAWIGIYAVSEVRTPTAVPVSSGYWPVVRGTFTVPYRGVTWKSVDASQAVPLAPELMVKLGEHDGIPYYGYQGDVPGGGGGGVGNTGYTRLYVRTDDGRFLPLVPSTPDPDAGRFLPENQPAPAPER